MIFKHYSSTVKQMKPVFLKKIEELAIYSFSNRSGQINYIQLK